MIRAFIRKSVDVAQKRAKNGGIRIDTISLLKHCAGEVIEACEAYSKGNTDAFKMELGDIMCCALLICGFQGFDAEEILIRCYEKNKARADGIGDKL